MFSSEKYKIVLSFSILFIVTIVIFFHTVEMRKPWRTELSDVHHQWLSGSTIKFVNNWYKEGPLSLKFGLIENPQSIEFPTLLSRKPYPSYPPGIVLPLYILAKMVGYELTPSMLMKYNLLNQFFIAILLSLTVFCFLRQLKFDYLNSVLLSVVPIFIEFFTPATMYWHQNVFFTDQAIILPFVLFIFLEIVKGNINKKLILRTICILQALVMFYGALTDWFFVFVSFVVWLNRILKREMGNTLYSFAKSSLIFWFPFVLAILLFVIQLYSLDILPLIVDRFMFRTGLSSSGEKYIHGFFRKFWIGHIREGYGIFAIITLWGSLFLLIIGIFVKMLQKFTNNKGKINIHILSFISYLIVPCFLHTYFLRNHSVIHDFSALKYSLPLAVIPFVLAPILLLSIFNAQTTNIYIEGMALIINKTKINIKIYLVSFTLPLVLLTISMTDAEYYTKFFPEPNLEYRRIGEFISSNTTYSDIVFSTVYSVPKNPPQQLSYTRKRVYKIKTLDDIYEKVKDVKGDFVINLFMPKQYGLNNILNRLEPLEFQSSSTDNYSIFKINGHIFMERYQNNSKKIIE